MQYIQTKVEYVSQHHSGSEYWSGKGLIQRKAVNLSPHGRKFHLKPHLG